MNITRENHTAKSQNKKNGERRVKSRDSGEWGVGREGGKRKVRQVEKRGPVHAIHRECVIFFRKGNVIHTEMYFFRRTIVKCKINLSKHRLPLQDIYQNVCY